jgi:hypothetical protein
MKALVGPINVFFPKNILRNFQKFVITASAFGHNNC